MKLNYNIGVHERIKLYIVLWFLIVGVAVLFFTLTNFNDEAIECSDGSIVFDQKDCPQCVTDDECNADSYCSLNQCRSKRCELDDDCVLPGNQCIFGTCQNIGTTDLDDL